MKKSSSKKAKPSKFRLMNPITGKGIRFRKLPAYIEAKLNEPMPWPTREPTLCTFASSLVDIEGIDSVRPRRYYSLDPKSKGVKGPIIFICPTL